MAKKKSEIDVGKGFKRIFLCCSNGMGSFLNCIYTCRSKRMYTLQRLCTCPSVWQLVGEWLVRTTFSNSNLVGSNNHSSLFLFEMDWCRF